MDGSVRRNSTKPYQKEEEEQEGPKAEEEVSSLSSSELPPPPDGGWGWVVVFASFMIHIVGECKWAQK